MHQPGKKWNDSKGLKGFQIGMKFYVQVDFLEYFDIVTLFNY